MAEQMKHWWLADKGELPTALSALTSRLEQQSGVTRAANLHHLRMYTNRATESLGGVDVASGIDGGERIKLNVGKSAIDAAVAQIATNRPRPMFLTEGGSYEKREQAKRLARFIMGQFYKLRQYELSLDIFRDACVFGTGIEKIYHDGKGYICAERVLPDEILVDENECRTGKPRQLFQRKIVSREILQALYPKAKRILEDASSGEQWSYTPFTTGYGVVDPVAVYEGWRLPSCEDAGDGRHVICVSSGVLLDEEWERDCFPFAFFRWNTSPVGFFGVGAIEELAPIQVEINYIAQKIQKLMTLQTSTVWKEKNSFSGRITNEDLAIYEYTGRPPIFQQSGSVSGEYFLHLDRLYNRAYEIVGISQLQATSKKPGGLESGEALRIYNDVGTRRFQHTGQRWEQFHMDIASLILETAREIDEAGFPQEVLAEGDKEVERINFSEVDLDDDVYVMKIHPVSIIPDTPAGKVDIMQKLAQMSPDLAPRVVAMLSGIPDLEAEMDLVTAPRRLAMKMIGNILAHGKYQSPSPYMDLELTRRLAQESLCEAEVDEVEEEKLEMLRTFIEEVDRLQKPPAPPAASVPGMPGAQPGLAPPGGPVPPPGLPGGAPSPARPPMPMPPPGMMPGRGPVPG